MTVSFSLDLLFSVKVMMKLFLEPPPQQMYTSGLGVQAFSVT